MLFKWFRQKSEEALPGTSTKDETHESAMVEVREARARAEELLQHTKLQGVQFRRLAAKYEELSRIDPYARMFRDSLRNGGAT